MRTLTWCLVIPGALLAQDRAQRGRDNAPKAGDTAPDFELRRHEKPDEKVKLSSFRDRRPVVLIFGSYT